MDSENVELEQRLNSFFIQLQNEFRVFDRIVDKGKNQHRRCFYFQYIMKVRRDVKLLLSAGLQEMWDFLFQIINEKKPTRTVNLLESLKRRKCNNEKYNYQERLLGMVEPMVKAAIEISSLLARSFFMGFSVTILAILGRLRVLVQQILLDVVSVFNMISSISQKEHSVKLNRQGIQVDLPYPLSEPSNLTSFPLFPQGFYQFMTLFLLVQVIREYYPSNDEHVTLECIWEQDKFVLLEKVNKFEIKKRETGLQSSNIKYQTVEAFLGLEDDETGYKKIGTDKSIEEHPNFKSICGHEAGKSAEQPMNISVNAKVELQESIIDEDIKSNEKPLDKSSGIDKEEAANPSPKSPQPPIVVKRKVLFISIGKPKSSQTSESSLIMYQLLVCLLPKTSEEKDPFFSLLTGGTVRDSLFKI
ncbi:hypothetical protein MKW92_052921 [Papaver armeniacum]|nr:hypothetical protein MKW92_052921 [Papaver armeniacum]